MTRRSFLTRVELFNQLNEDVLESIADVLSERALTEKEVLFNQGDPGDALIIVKQGKLAIYTPIEGAPAEGIPIRLFSRGEVLGEMSLIDDKPRSLSARAEEPSTVLTLSATDFRRLLQAYPDMIGISTLKMMSEKLRYTTDYLDAVQQVAITDPLTGLYSRRYFENEMTRLNNSRMYPISIIMMDINFLKKVNDTIGHSAGDELLKRTAQVLHTVFRAEDVVARIGGDEFAVLIPNADKDAAQQAVNRLKDNLELHNRAYPDFPLSISIGSATGEGNSKLVDIMKQADENMYQEKTRLKAQRPR